tara:strand:- start:892 stop:1236 length:345 start_codon:yes stop_codon:yes gene_type:complete
VLKSEETRLKIQQAGQLAAMQQTAGWKIIEERLRAQVQSCKDRLCQRGLEHQQSEELRYQIYVMQWLLRSVRLTEPEQLAKWEGELAFHAKQEKMREQAGLSPDLRELKNDQTD